MPHQIRLACQGAHFPLWERQAQQQASGTTHLSRSAPFSRQSPQLGTPEEETPARPDLKLPFAIQMSHEGTVERILLIPQEWTLGRLQND